VKYQIKRLLLYPGIILFLILTSIPARGLPAAPPSLSSTTVSIEIAFGGPVANALFTAPIQVTHAGDGSGRLFVVQQDGKILIIKNGQVLAQPFLNISSLVVYNGERGLLGLAFHPDYPATPYFYVNYSRLSDGDTVIARYTITADPDIANPSSASVLLTVDQPDTNHNGGQLLFSPIDGYLYIGMGDGGGSNDTQNRAQNLNTLLGKMLRLDVDGAFPYAVPADNPYVGVSGLDEIWALGLRNPWRFSFDRLTGDLYIGDVGQNAWEEIDFQAAGTPGGVNYGWRCREGMHNFNFEPSCQLLTLTEPVAEYSHSLGCSVSGGFVYRGQDFPDLAGHYFYGDYCSGRIWSIYQASSAPVSFSAPDLELDSPLRISAFGEDENGELYIADYNGTVRQLIQLPPNIANFPLIVR